MCDFWTPTSCVYAWTIYVCCNRHIYYVYHIEILQFDVTTTRDYIIWFVVRYTLKGLKIKGYINDIIIYYYINIKLFWTKLVDWNFKILWKINAKDIIFLIIQLLPSLKEPLKPQNFQNVIIYINIAISYFKGMINVSRLI